MCAFIISGAQKKCPSHYMSSLIQLNLTRGGSALEDCDCGKDDVNISCNPVNEKNDLLPNKISVAPDVFNLTLET